MKRWHPSAKGIGFKRVNGSGPLTVDSVYPAGMHPLILASEAAEHASSTPAGDDLAAIAYAMLGVVMLIAAIATWRVTPKLTH
jgi:hypothetical protein